MTRNQENSNTSIYCHYRDVKTVQKLSRFLQQNIEKNIVLACIGTDRCIGDALGPLVGTLLKKSGFPYPIYGTLSEPIHAVNLYHYLKNINRTHSNPFIIAIDASLGNKEHIGHISIRKGPLYPGKGVGKNLPPVGNLSIIGIVEDLHYNLSSSIHEVRLSLVMDMVETITAILNSLKNMKNVPSPY